MNDPIYGENYGNLLECTLNRLAVVEEGNSAEATTWSLLGLLQECSDAHAAIEEAIRKHLFPS